MSEGSGSGSSVVGKVISVSIGLFLIAFGLSAIISFMLSLVDGAAASPLGQNTVSLGLLTGIHGWLAAMLEYNGSLKIVSIVLGVAIIVVGLIR